MSKKSAKVVLAVLLAALLATLPGLAGCGEEEVARTEIVVGFLEDLTGPAGFAVQQTYNGIQDYFRMVEEDDPIPGVKLKLINYDTRLEYARVAAGYIWLKGKGTKLFMMLTSTMEEIVVDNFEEDQIPLFGFQATPSLLGRDWIFHFCPAWSWEADCIMEWIFENWEYDEEEGPPKVGHIGVSGYMGPVIVMERLEELHAEYSDEFELTDQWAPWGARTWAGEIDALKDCDFIIPTIYGPQMVSFLKESTDRGFQGKFIGTSGVLVGFWDLVRAAMPLEDVDGTLSLFAWPYWTDDIPFIAQCRDRLPKYRPGEEEFHLRQTGWMTGQALGMIISDVIRRAVEEVGAENVDGSALNDALAELNITVQGWGNQPWQFTEEYSILLRELRMYEYSAAEDSWFAVTGWYPPLSLGGQ